MYGIVFAIDYDFIDLREQNFESFSDVRGTDIQDIINSLI
jgi:hypothetical protein